MWRISINKYYSSCKMECYCKLIFLVIYVCMKEYFLDANSHIPINKKALETFIKLNNSLEGHGHPSAISSPGRAASSLLEESRNKIANLIGAKNPNQIIFTHGCTHAAEWVMYILSKNFKNKFITCSSVEHPAVRLAIEKYLDYLPLRMKSNGDICLIENSDGIICTHLQNEFGSIYNPKKLNSKFIVMDCSQSLGKIQVNVTEMNVDIAFFAGHKFGGFNGVGFIYLKDTSLWKPFGTGSRYAMDRTGTLDPISIAATAVALENALDTLEYRIENCRKFKEKLEKELELLGWHIVAKNSERSPNTTFLNFPEKALQTLVKLNENKIYIGVGSACGSSATGLSPSIKALGYSGNPSDFIRISQWGEYDDKDAEYILNKIYEVT